MVREVRLHTSPNPTMNSSGLWSSDAIACLALRVGTDNNAVRPAISDIPVATDSLHCIFRSDPRWARALRMRLRWRRSLHEERRRVKSETFGH